jgi:hypothetical protein
MNINYKLAFAFFTLGTLSFFNAQNNKNAQVTNNPTTINLQNRGCGTGILPQQFETWVQNITPAGGKNGGQSSSVLSVYNIPVVVHVIHNNEPLNSPTATTGGNLNAAQIQDQINILNKDFNGTNPDTNLIPAVFKPFLGKFQVNFCLAVVNPTGGVMAEPGIDRINRTSKGWTAPPYSTTYIDATIKPNSIWDPNKYMNMWVCSISGGVLGYATFPNPGTSGLLGLPAPYGSATTDGLVMRNTTFGSIGTAVSGAPYNKGRTATHEIGHWMGLRHIWGDGTCATDYCNDTPPAQTANYNCPVHPYKLGTCAGNTTGEMTMNYMDYTNDACMYMFSKDQKMRAQLIMTNSPMRASLLTSTVCNLPTVINDIAILYVVSPTYSQAITCNNFITPTVAIKNMGSNAITSATYTYNVDGVNTQTYSWSGNIAPNASLTISMPQINNLSNAAHVYNVGVFNPNGSIDPNMTNNYNNQFFSISGSFTLSANSATICAGTSTTLNASGSATTYSWNPGAITGATAVVSPTATTIYTLTGKTGTCVNTFTTNVIVSATIPIVVNSSTICSGNSATLTASGAVNYTWNPGNTNGNSAIVSPTATTIYTVSGSNGSCSGTTTTNINVNSIPTVAVNSGTICSGNSTALTASGANTYSWNTGATTSSVSVSPTVTTIYTVIGFNGTCSSSKTSTVTVNPSPVITVNNASLCSGSSATLTASGANSYLWNTGATTTSIVVTPTASIIYTVTGTSAGCNSIKTSTVNVTSTPTVAANNATICNGVTAILNASGATTYSWNTGISTASAAVNPTTTTSYTVNGFNGACSSAKTLTVFVLPKPIISILSATLCSGNSTVIAASGANTYTWNTGAIAPTISINPLTSTVYTVTGTNTVGCSSTQTTQVTVNTTPTVSVNNATVCSGGTGTLSASGATSYSWNTGSTNSSITVSPVINTIYTVTGNSLGCSNTKTVSVTIGTGLTINITTTTSTICSGSSANLSASGASTYTWNTGSNNSSIAVSPTVNTTYTVAGFNAGCSGSNTIAINVNPIPVITANALPATICAGQSSSLAANGASTYTWNPGGNGANINVSPASSTVYTVTGSSSGCNGTKTVAIVVNANPTITAISNSSVLCTGNSSTISASGATSYSWNTGATTPFIVVSPTTTTTYTITGNNGNCSANTIITQSVSLCTALIDNTSLEPNALIYPNPFINELHIKSNSNVLVSLYNCLGQLITEKIIVNEGLLNTQVLSDGLYYLTIKGQNGIRTYRVIKN